MPPKTVAENPKQPSPNPRITPQNPERPFTFKPIIRDILATEICIPGSIFLVEKIERIEATLENPAAVRLLLGDGEVCVQAFLRPEVWGCVDGEEVGMGCYVGLERFEVRREEMEGIGDGVLSRKRKRRREVVFLVVERLETVGWDYEYMKYAKPAARPSASVAIPSEGAISDSDEVDDAGDVNPEISPTVGEMVTDENVLMDEFDLEQFSDDPSILHSQESVTNRDAQEVLPTTGITRQADSQYDTPDPEESNSKNPPSHSLDGLFEPTNNVTPPPKTLSPEPNRPSLTTNLNTTIPREINHIPTPLRNKTSLIPRTLASLSKLPARQNSPCTVFAIIDAISPIKPCPIPPYQTREIRLVDPSTPKRVLLSVLWKPEDFNPEVGTPVLLRGLKNHRYDGGSLNAYPKSVSAFVKDGGVNWWVPWPRGWDGCDVVGYVEWWKERQKNKGMSS